MDYFDLIINLVCFALLFAFFPSGLLTRHQQHTHQHHSDNHHTLHGHLHLAASPLASPRSATFEKSTSDLLTEPSIILTPSQPSHRPGHSKRKSVSFSLSSMSEIVPRRENGEANKKRPPTPYVSGPVSPSQRRHSSPLPSIPATPLLQNVEVVDPMGVQKKWLMA